MKEPEGYPVFAREEAQLPVTAPGETPRVVLAYVPLGRVKVVG